MASLAMIIPAMIMMNPSLKLYGGYFGSGCSGYSMWVSFLVIASFRRRDGLF